MKAPRANGCPLGLDLTMTFLTILAFLRNHYFFSLRANRFTYELACTMYNTCYHQTTQLRAVSPTDLLSRQCIERA
jgi:hypothetical protein